MNDNSVPMKVSINAHLFTCSLLKFLSKPKGFEKMKDLAKILSKGFSHVRVDLYDINGNIYFGEMTFYNSSGFAEFAPFKWQEIFGSWIKLPTKM